MEYTGRCNNQSLLSGKDVIKKIIKNIVLAGLLLSAANLFATTNDGLKLYQQECGSCHLAYPASLLPTKSWDNIIAHLDDHFGDSADLPADEAASIKTYLDDNGYKSGFMSGIFGRYGSNEVPERITAADFFKSKHGEISVEAVKNNPKVKSFSRCDACHASAKSGNFEDNIHIPGGYSQGE